MYSALSIATGTSQHGAQTCLCPVHHLGSNLALVSAIFIFCLCSVRDTLQPKRKGPKPLVDESALVEWFERERQLGRPPTRDNIISEASRMYNDSVRTDDRPSTTLTLKSMEKWWRLFLCRHPEVSGRLAQHGESVRVDKKLTKDEWTTWFNESSGPELAKVGYDPQYVFNEDESGMFIDFDIGSLKIYVLRATKTCAKSRGYLEDLWSIPLPLERGELRVREWNRYIRKYRRSLKLVEDWNEASEIRHLLKDVLPGHWKRRVQDEEKKRAKKRVAVRIMASEDTHAGIMEFFQRNLGEPSRMLGLKNAVYVEVFGDTMGQRLMRLNNVEWRRGEPLRMQIIFARMSLDEIVKYITVELKLNAKNEVQVQDRQGQGHRGHREDHHHREVKGDPVGTAEDGSGSGQDHWNATTPEDHEEAHFFAFVAHNMKENGQDRSRWNRLDPRTKNRRSQHTGCWVCYDKGNNHAHDHRHCKVYEEDKKTYFAAHPDKKPKEQRIADWKAKGGDGGKGQGKGQGKGGGKGYGGGPGPDRRVRSIEEVAEDMLRTLEELKAQQRGGQSLSGSQQEGAAAGHV